MNNDRIKRMGPGRSLLLLVLILVSLEMKASILTAMPQSRDAIAYNKAYSLVLDEKWAEAGRAMAGLIRDFPGSSWVDDASFWKCYTQEKLKMPRETVFKGYQDFINAYPSSAWVNDAKACMVRIGRELIRSGKNEYEAVIKSLGMSGDQEIRLTALYALEKIGDEDALNTILAIYDKTSNPRLQEKIIFMLQDFDSPVAFAKLKEIALGDPSPKARGERPLCHCGQA